VNKTDEPNKFAKDVFISYSTVDSDQVLDFVNMLKNSGIDFWLDKMDIGWGESIIEKVFAGIESSRFVIVFISTNSIKSPWVRKEIFTAFHREIESNATVLLPVLSCPQEDFFQAFPFLRSKKYIKFDDKGQIVSSLIKLLRGESNTRFTLNHLRAYHGPVWIRLIAMSENDEVDHNVSIRWGPWYREIFVSLSASEPLFLTHSKGNDGESIPIRIHLDKPAYVMIGQGAPNSLRCIDINPFWVDAESNIKKWIAKTFLWP
jgi:hypothetical protein